MREPESGKAAKQQREDQLGSFTALPGNPQWRSRAIFGALLGVTWLGFLFLLGLLILPFLPETRGKELPE